MKEGKINAAPLMKTQFKYLSFVGTALVIAAGSTAALAQSGAGSDMCNYTPENRQCISQGVRNNPMGSSYRMSSPSRMDNSRSNAPTQMSVPRANQNTESNQMTNPETKVKDNPVNGPGVVDSNRMNSPSTNQR